MKHKAKNMTERLGFVDDDLRCPVHDRMSLFLSIPKQAASVISGAGVSVVSALDFVNSMTKHDVIEMLSYTRRIPKDAFDQTAEINVFAEHVVRLEHPVVKGVGRYAAIVGYVDCEIDLMLEINALLKPDSLGNQNAIRSTEHLGTYWIEAKPSMPNPMEVLRQIKTYLTFAEPNVRVVVWCPTVNDDVASMLASQKNILVSRVPWE